MAYTLRMVFIELPLFQRQISFTDETLRSVQRVILENPLAGDVIPGGHGLRKLRVAFEGRGKRGSARVIYYWWSKQDRCYLVFAYAKNVQENLTVDQTRRLADLMREIIQHE